MERYEQDDLPGFLDAEAQARESDIPPEASFEHKRRMAIRWFRYYKKQKDSNQAIIIRHQYNRIARMCSRQRS